MLSGPRYTPLALNAVRMGNIMQYNKATICLDLDVHLKYLSIHMPAKSTYTVCIIGQLYVEHPIA